MEDALTSNFMNQMKGIFPVPEHLGKEQAQQYFIFSDMEMVPATHLTGSPTRYVSIALFRTPLSMAND